MSRTIEWCVSKKKIIVVEHFQGHRTISQCFTVKISCESAEDLNMVKTP